MFFNRSDGISERLCHIVRRRSLRQHIDRKRVPETMRMSISNACKRCKFICASKIALGPDAAKNGTCDTTISNRSNRQTE
jgi:hypothetical protein